VINYGIGPAGAVALVLAICAWLLWRKGRPLQAFAFGSLVAVVWLARFRLPFDGSHERPPELVRCSCCSPVAGQSFSAFHEEGSDCTTDRLSGVLHLRHDGILTSRELGLMAWTAETKMGPISVPAPVQKKKKSSAFSVAHLGDGPAICVRFIWRAAIWCGWSDTADVR
jgi:hypothetical protein